MLASIRHGDVEGRPLRCPGGADDGEGCLSDSQIATLRTYATPIVFQSALASGEAQYPGYNIYGADLGRSGASPWQGS